MIYIREAHPVDGWWLGGGLPGLLFKLKGTKAAMDVTDPKTMEERRAVAGQCEVALQFRVRTYVDEMDDRVSKAYAALPTCLYLVGRDGAVVFRGFPLASAEDFDTFVEGFGWESFSYDESLSLLDCRMIARPLARVDNLGGAAWRVRWHPVDPWLLGVPCMRAGFRVLRFAEGEQVAAATEDLRSRIVSRYAKSPPMTTGK